MLSDFVTAYALRSDLSPGYIQQLRVTVNKFAAWLGRPARLKDLADDTVNRWLGSIALSRQTIATQRRNLLVLWRAAFQDELVDELPRRVRRIQVPRTLPLAWELSQLDALLTAAGKLRGVFRRSRVRKAAWWRAFVLAGWDTGLRLGDLLHLRFDAIGSDGTLCVLQRKTNSPLLCKLRPETVAAVLATSPPARELVFGGVLGRDQIFKQFRALCATAGFSGTTKGLRKSSATWVESLQPGAGKTHLGHLSDGVAAKHYLDPRVVGRFRTVPLPPAIG